MFDCQIVITFSLKVIRRLQTLLLGIGNAVLFEILRSGFSPIYESCSTVLFIDPFKPIVIFHSYQLDQSSCLEVVLTLI